MAIQLVFETPDGVEHPAAYARIFRTVIENPQAGEKNVSIDVVIHATKAKRNAGKSPIWGPQGYLVQNPVPPVDPPPEEPPVEPPVEPDPPEPPPVVYECAVNPDVVKLTELYAWLKTQPGFMEGEDV